MKTDKAGKDQFIRIWSDYKAETLAGRYFRVIITRCPIFRQLLRKIFCSLNRRTLSYLVRGRFYAKLTVFTIRPVLAPTHSETEMPISGSCQQTSQSANRNLSRAFIAERIFSASGKPRDDLPEQSDNAAEALEDMSLSNSCSRRLVGSSTAHVQVDPLAANVRMC